MAFLGMLLSFIFGFAGLPWWSAIFSGLIMIQGTVQQHPEKGNVFGSPLGMVWGILPAIFIWWLGTLIG